MLLTRSKCCVNESVWASRPRPSIRTNTFTADLIGLEWLPRWRTMMQHVIHRNYSFAGAIQYCCVLLLYLQLKPNPQGRGVRKWWKTLANAQLMKRFQQSGTLGSHPRHTKSTRRDNSGLTVNMGCFRSVCTALACVSYVSGQGNKRFNFPVSGPLKSIGAVRNSGVWMILTNSSGEGG